uniref:Uncharacterized protein n=1 Tax=Panagrolaimus sp. ES5 TaxID=591445 RepID=A0AC34F4G4_9BILA
MDRNVYVESNSLSPESSRNVAFGIDGAAPSSNSSSNAAVGIDSDSLRAPKSVNGLRAPCSSSIGSSNATNDDKTYGLRVPSFEGLRAPKEVNNVGCSRAENVIYGDGV